MSLPEIFVISLPRSERRPRIARRLAACSGAWTFIDAINGASLSSEVLRTLYNETAAIKNFGSPLSPGEIGCALSHRLVYETIIQRQLPWAIVLEDDAIPADGFASFPFSSVPADFDVVSFFTPLALVHKRPERAIGDYRIHRAAGKAYSTLAYLVSLKGARKLRTATETIHNVADWPIDPQDLSFYVVSPNLFGDEQQDSEISPRGRQGRQQWRKGGGYKDLLTEGLIGYITTPLFIKYALRPERYAGLTDYYRREIDFRVKRRMPMFYRLVSHYKKCS